MPQDNNAYFSIGYTEKGNADGKRFPLDGKAAAATGKPGGDEVAAGQEKSLRETGQLARLVDDARVALHHAVQFR